MRDVVADLDLVVQAHVFLEHGVLDARRDRWWCWRRSRSRRRPRRRPVAAPSASGRRPSPGRSRRRRARRPGWISTRWPRRTRRTSVTRATSSQPSPTTQSSPMTQPGPMMAPAATVLRAPMLDERADLRRADRRRASCATTADGMDAWRGGVAMVEQRRDPREGDIRIVGEQRGARHSRRHRPRASRPRPPRCRRVARGSADWRGTRAVSVPRARASRPRRCGSRRRLQLQPEAFRQLPLRCRKTNARSRHDVRHAQDELPQNCPPKVNCRRSISSPGSLLIGNA